MKFLSGPTTEAIAIKSGEESTFMTAAVASAGTWAVEPALTGRQILTAQTAAQKEASSGFPATISAFSPLIHIKTNTAFFTE